MRRNEDDGLRFCAGEIDLVEQVLPGDLEVSSEAMASLARKSNAAEAFNPIAIQDVFGKSCPRQLAEREKSWLGIDCGVRLAGSLASPIDSVARLGKNVTGGVIRNIIFDWSGTLVDDLPAVWKATNYVLSQAERAEMSLEQFRAEFCLPFTIFYERHLPHVPLPQVETWFHSRFKLVQDSVCELPHSREFLEFCRERGMRTFLLSTVHRDHFAVQSAATGLGEYLDKPPWTGTSGKRYMKF
jgi:hypothetical protein